MLIQLSLSSAVCDAAACKFIHGLSPIGQNPLDKAVVTKKWAGASYTLLGRTRTGLLKYLHTD
jgi:hypothetical protein